MTTPSLLDWIMDMLRHEPARDAFQANPQAAMASAGFSGACREDVHDSKPFLLDHPGVKWVHKDRDDHDGHDGHNGHGDHDDAAEYIKYIVNNYTYSPHTENNYLHKGGNPGHGNGHPDIEIEDSTVTDSLNHEKTITKNSDDDGTVSSGGTVVDSEIMGDNEQDGNLVFGNLTNGDHSVDTEVDADGEDSQAAGRDAEDNDVEAEDDSQAAGRDLDNTDVDADGEESQAAGRDVNDNDVDAEADGKGSQAAGRDLEDNDLVDVDELHVLSDLINTDDGSDFIDELPVLSDNGTQSILDDLGPLL